VFDLQKSFALRAVFSNGALPQTLVIYILILQLVVLRPPQTVMLASTPSFATSKMLISFQKISEGVDRLTAIWF
jgi:hypothetical protein